MVPPRGKPDGSIVARISQIAFFTRDGDMRGRRSRISRPERGALIRATIPGGLDMDGPDDAISRSETAQRIANMTTDWLSRAVSHITRAASRYLLAGFAIWATQIHAQAQIYPAKPIK